MLYAVRGAVSVPENRAEAIQSSVKELIEALLAQNAIQAERVVSLFFTVTPDLTALNPARALRESLAGWQAVPMLCLQEPITEGMLERCIRVLIQWEAPGEHRESVVPVYLGKAKSLRPDL